MAVYKSDEVSLAVAADKVFSKLSNLEGLGNILKNVPEDKIPADKRQALEQVSVTSDSISFPGGPAGAITLRMAEKAEPSLIRLEGVNTPVPLSMMLHIISTGEETSEAQVEVDIKIPAMLKPMIGGTMQKMVNEFANMLRSIPYN